MVSVLCNLKTYIVAYATNTWETSMGLLVGKFIRMGFFHCNILKEVAAFTNCTDDATQKPIFLFYFLALVTSLAIMFMFQVVLFWMS